jgi:oxalate decarboxylase
MAPSRRTVLATGAAGLVTAAASANAQTTGQGSPPQPMRPGRGGTDPGPRNIPIELQNPDIFVPPPTDHGTVANLKYPFSLSHMRLERGGWTRQVTERELGISKEIAGVDMRLNTGGVRELHWHKAAEWAYMLYGRARITAVDEEGRQFVDDVGVGDLWYFPKGIPHSIQGLGPDGCEFLLVFDDGSFSEDNTFLLTIGSGTCRPTCWARTSACRRRTSTTRRIRASSTSSRCRCRGRSPMTASPAPCRCPTRSVIA